MEIEVNSTITGLYHPTSPFRLIKKYSLIENGIDSVKIKYACWSVLCTTNSRIFPQELIIGRICPKIENDEFMESYSAEYMGKPGILGWYDTIDLALDAIKKIDGGN